MHRPLKIFSKISLNLLWNLECRWSDFDPFQYLRGRQQMYMYQSQLADKIRIVFETSNQLCMVTIFCFEKIYHTGNYFTLTRQLHLTTLAFGNGKKNGFTTKWSTRKTHFCLFCRFCPVFYRGQILSVAPLKIFLSGTKFVQLSQTIRICFKSVRDNRKFVLKNSYFASADRPLVKILS